MNQDRSFQEVYWARRYSCRQTPKGNSVETQNQFNDLYVNELLGKFRFGNDWSPQENFLLLTFVFDRQICCLLRAVGHRIACAAGVTSWRRYRIHHLGRGLNSIANTLIWWWKKTKKFREIRQCSFVRLSMALERLKAFSDRWKFVEWLKEGELMWKIGKKCPSFWSRMTFWFSIKS